jgi:polyisoprenoid-binding protein YceI
MSGPHRAISTQGEHTMSAATQTQTTWQIDPAHSSVEFAVKHMMFTTVKGRFSGVAGTIVLDQQNVAASSVKATIEATTIDTRDENRDNHLRSAEFFDVARFPQITFESTNIHQTGAGEAHAHGKLTMHGVTNEVAFPVTFHGSGKSPFGTVVAGFSGGFTISRKDYGLVWNVALETGGVMVSDNVTITLDIEAVQQ